jgi:hypothetical protein
MLTYCCREEYNFVCEYKHNSVLPTVYLLFMNALEEDVQNCGSFAASNSNWKGRHYKYI